MLTATAILTRCWRALSQAPFIAVSRSCKPTRESSLLAFANRLRFTVVGARTDPQSRLVTESSKNDRNSVTAICQRRSRTWPFWHDRMRRFVAGEAPHARDESRSQEGLSNVGSQRALLRGYALVLVGAGVALRDDQVVELTLTTGFAMAFSKAAVAWGRLRHVGARGPHPHTRRLGDVAT